MTGSTGRFALGLVAVLVPAVFLPAAPALARAPEPMPDVHGLSVPDTRRALQAWNKGVVITFQPDLKQLPPGATESTVVASRAEQVITPGQVSSATGPRVLVTLGALMPDLTGLTQPQARSALADRGLTLAADRLVPADWVVSSQPPPGSVVEFRPPVQVGFAAPAVVVPPTQPPHRLLPVSLPVAVGAGAVVLLLLVLATLLVARSIRRGRRRRQARPREHIEVRAVPGQVTGPDVFDLPAAAPVASVPPREVRS